MSDPWWTILNSQPGVGVLIIDAHGRVLHANRQAGRILYGDPRDAPGPTLDLCEGPEVAEEMLGVIRQVLTSGQPLRFRHIRGGRRTETTFWRLDAGPPEDRIPRVAAICRRDVGDPDDVDEWPVVESRFVDLGPLDVLTPRELEVMALLGRGVPLKAIAQQLRITQRTVERYRTDIARKLRINSMAEIVRIARSAGLRVEHAYQPRIRRWRGTKHPELPPPPG